MSKRTTIGAIALIVGLVGAHVEAGGILYVDDDAPLAGDGLSWDTAYRYLQDALAAAASSGGAVTEIRVAQGVYAPDRDEGGLVVPGSRDATLQLLDGVILRGGYLGLSAGKGDDRDERNIARFVTIFSGDLLGNDVPDDIPSRIDNSYHVVTASGTDDTARIEGVTITAGHADGPGRGGRTGGGVRNVGGAATFVECTFCLNVGGDEGGGMHNVGASPTLIDCSFESNRTDLGSNGHGGGGMCNVTSTPTLEGCTFAGNTAPRGAGMTNADGTVASLTNCTFRSNGTFNTDIASNFGGAIYNFNAVGLTALSCSFNSNSSFGSGAGIANLHDCELTMSACSFTANLAFDGGGGGVYNRYNTHATIVDCVFVDNDASSVGGGIADVEGGVAEVSGCQFTLNFAGLGGGGFSLTGTYTDCNFELNGGHDGGGGLWVAAGAVSHCTFTNNYSTDGSGGAIHVEEGDATISQCTIIDNEADEGGGISVQEAAPLIVDCFFMGNDGTSGGGLYTFTGGNATIVNCVLAGNHGGFGGGGAYNEVQVSPLFVNCLFTGNTGSRGAAVRNRQGAYPLLVNCTLSGNAAVNTAGGIFSQFDAAPALANCIVWGNTDGDPATDTEGAQIFTIDQPTTVDYSCIEGLTGSLGGIGNTGANPLFADADGADGQVGTEDDDVRLLLGSPCVDAGHNWAVAPDHADLDGDGDIAELMPFDLDGAARFANDTAAGDIGCGEPAIIDMGAFEFQGIPMDVVYGDIDGNGSVGITDLLGLLAAWGDTNDDCELADLDLDGEVNANDLMIVLASWR